MFSTVKHVLCLFALITVIGSNVPASADVIATNFNGDTGYKNTSWTVIYGSTIAEQYGSSPYSFAIAFTVDSLSAVDSYELPIGSSGGGSNRFDLELRTDANGEPGKVIDLLELEPELTYVSFGDPLWVFDSASQPTLEPGVTYWLNISPAADDTYIGWCSTAEREDRTSALYRFNTDTWTVYPPSWTSSVAFRINGHEVPEPASLGLFAVATLVLIKRHRTRNIESQA